MNIFDQLRRDLWSKHLSGEIDVAVDKYGVVWALSVFEWIINQVEEDVAKSIGESLKDFMKSQLNIIQEAYDKTVTEIENIWIFVDDLGWWMRKEEIYELYKMQIDSKEKHWIVFLEWVLEGIDKSNPYYPDLQERVKDLEVNLRKIATDKRVSLWLETRTINAQSDSQ